MTADDAIGHAAQLLREGKLVAFPTETVYGLGADAENDHAVARIFDVKGRPRNHPLIVHIADADQLERWSDAVLPAARALAEAFWPGPLTLIVPRLRLPPLAASGGHCSIGLRVPDHPCALALLRSFGGGIAAPSANRFGRVSPTTAEHVRAELGARVDCVLDGGPARIGVESTIVDFVGDRVRLLRPGGVTVEQLEALLAAPVERPGAARGVRAPGLLPSHYAPRAQVVLAESVADLRAQVGAARAAGRQAFGLVASAAGEDGGRADVVHLGPDDVTRARRLYAALRDLDERGAELIVALLPRDEGLGLAIGDRLRKAAGPR